MGKGGAPNSASSEEPALSQSRWGLLPRVLLAQFLAFFLILIGAWAISAVFGLVRPPAWLLAVMQGILAVAVSHRIGLRKGWLVAQFFLPLMAWAGLLLQVPSWVFLIAFALLLLVYSNTSKERVPLYLTNRTTWQAISDILDEQSAQASPRSFVDLGCGVGGTLTYMAKRHPDWRIVGVETAPGPYLVSKIRTAFVPNAEVRFQNLWDVDLGAFDVVYAFLSPAPMPRLIEKATREMTAESVFVSNSFWAANLPYDSEIQLDDGRETRLFIKRLRRT